MLKYIGGVISVCLIFIFLVIFDVVKPSDNLSSNLLISIKSYGGSIDYTLSGFTTAEMDTPLKTYLTFIKEQPLEYLKQRLLSFNELWGWPSTGETERSIVKKLLIALRIPLLIGSITAFYLNLKKIEVWILFFPILTITAIHTLFFSTTRFSYVVEPFAIVLAVIAIVDLLKNPPKRKKTISSAV